MCSRGAARSNTALRGYVPGLQKHNTKTDAHTGSRYVTLQRAHESMQLHKDTRDVCVIDKLEDSMRLNLQTMLKGQTD